MPTTFALVFPTIESASDAVIDRLSTANEANFALVDSTPTSATYIYNAGSPSDVIQLYCSRTYNVKENTTYCRCEMSSDIRKTVSETGVVTDHPLKASINWSYEGKVAADVSLVGDFIERLIGFFMYPLSTGVPTWDKVAEFDRGILTQMV